MQTATNPKTGEKLVLVGEEWKPVEQSATNPKTGAKAYLVGGAWLQDEPKERGTGEELVRQVGLTARAALTGVSGLPGMLANVPAGIYNKGADIIQGEGKGFRFPDQTTVIANTLGLPKPENATERVVQDVAGAMAGTGSTVKAGEVVSKAASPVVAKVGQTFAAAPGGQTAAAAGGAGAAGIARENDLGIVGQIVAGVAGSILPGATAYGAKEAVRRGLRGGEEGRQRMVDNLKTFEAAGTTPSVGQAAETRVARGIESGVSKSPGGAGVMAAKAEKQGEEIAAKVEDLASSLAGKTSATDAGENIQKGVRAFKDGFKALQARLYGNLDKHIPKGTPIEVGGTQAALKELNADIPGAPNLSEWFKNAKIKGIDAALEADLKAAGETGKLPYEAIKKLRTLVGNELADNSLLSDVPRSKWKALYAALSDDLGVAAKNAGPEAVKSWDWANAFTSKQLQRLEQISGVVDKDIPEKVFAAATSGTRDGATTLTRVMGLVPADTRKEVSATVLRRLGLANPANQNELGERFSTETFLTNWNKLAPEAKAILFDKQGKDFRASLDKIAEVANNAREGSKVFANPSGTQQAISNQVAGGGALIALLTGHPLMAAGIAGATGGSNLTARLMTNPKFVKWLATTSAKPAEAIPAQLNVLSVIGKSGSEQERQDIEQFIQAAPGPQARSAQ